MPALAAANGLRDPNLVLAGTTLTIPPPAAPARRPAPAGPATSGALRDKVVAMPAATLAAARSAPRIVVPADRAGLRIAFLRFSRLAGVPSDLAMALAWQESGWQRNKVSSTRAIGVMQLMPDTVDFVSRQLLGTAPLDPRDPRPTHGRVSAGCGSGRGGRGSAAVPVTVGGFLVRLGASVQG